MDWVRDHARAKLDKHLGPLKHLANSLPENGGPQRAGADWTPHRPPYDVKLPVRPVSYTEEEKNAQREAGKQLIQSVKEAIDDKQPVLQVPRGVYRLSDAGDGSSGPLMLCDSTNFTFRGPGAEIIVENEGGHARVLSNSNLTIEGSPEEPLIIDSEPLGFTQGHIIASDKEDLTIDIQIMEGYTPVKDCGGRIEVFSPDGVMLPHNQDPTKGVEDLGEGRFRLKMGDWTTWEPALPAGLDKFAPGNLLALEQGHIGGFEMRNNTGVKFRDVAMHCTALVWAGPEKGDDVYERFRGCRRPGTNRLIGGGWPLQTFFSGSYTMIDSEIAQNFDDVTDIFTPNDYAFEQRSPREVYLFGWDGNPVEDGSELTLYKYPSFECVGKTRTVSHEDEVDEDVQKRWFELCKKLNFRELGSPRLYTLADDIEVGELLMVDNDSKCSSMKFINCYLHDGLAGGAQLKGAHEVLIQNCVIERCNMPGIGVGLDSFWWEGTPSENIRILNNTVMHCPYGPHYPAQDIPAIQVFAGDNDPRTTCPVQRNVEIRGNLVMGSLAAGISVRQCSDVVVADNVIVHYPEHDGGYAAIQLDVVTQGTEITNNTFVNLSRDAWQLPISIGPRSSPEVLRLSNNRTQDPAEQVPDTAWQFFWWSTSPGCKLEGEWVLEADHDYPNERAWTNKSDAKVTFEFEGSEVAVRGKRCKKSGKCDVYLDDQHQGCFDMSRMYSQFCIVYRSQPLQHGRHSIRLEGLEKGEFSCDDLQFYLEGFYVLAQGGHDGLCTV